MPPRPQRPPQHPPAPQPPPKEEPPREIIRDTFQKFKKDPRINTSVLKEIKPRLFKTTKQNEVLLLTQATDAIFQLSREFGLPSFLSSYKQTQEVNWALLVDWDDLDAITATESTKNFSVVYSNRGETYGKKNSIDNQLFFEKAFPQRKVWSYDHFIDHQMNKAMDEERLTLMGTHALSADAAFGSLLAQQILRLGYDRPLTPSFENDLQSQKQLIMAKYPDLRFPHTPEGAKDLVFLVRSTQLLQGRIFPDLRHPHLPDVMNALKTHTIFKKEPLENLMNCYEAYISKPFENPVGIK